MSIHYKFKSALDFDTLTFDGLHISVGDLKKSIIQQKRIGKTTDFDLKIINAQTKEEYDTDTYLIPKNTSLIIARIPLAHLPKKTWEQQLPHSKSVSKVDKVVLDLSKMNGSEEDKIQAMMVQSSADYDPKGYQKIRGQFQTGEVPTSYRCNKCKKGGHWIKNCPYNGKDHIETKRTTGIPKSFRENTDKFRLQGLNEIDLPSSEQNDIVPEDLICSICKDIFMDAVMIPCCGSSFCDDCVRTSLLESEDNECPDCKEKGSSPGSLIPNRFLRNSVNIFKNETGYKCPEKRRVTKKSTVITGSAVDQSSSTNEVLDNVLNSLDTSTQNQNTEMEENLSNKSSDLVNDHFGNSEMQSTTTNNLESDYEDNIIVTVPATLIKYHSTLKNKPNEENNSYNSKIDHPLRHKQYSPKSTFDDCIKSTQTKCDWKENYIEVEKGCKGPPRAVELMPSKKNKSIISQIKFNNCSPLDVLPATTDPARQSNLYPRPGHHYQQVQQFAMQVPTARMTPIDYNPIVCNSYSHVFQQPYDSRYLSTECPRNQPVIPSPNFSYVYQGVAAKVGSGVIDDPLEAFNRIMREKELYKERRSQTRRRSGSTEETFRSRSSSQLCRRDCLPHDYKRSRDFKQKEMRRNSREKKTERNRGHDSGVNRQKSSYTFNERSSRSRSRSNPTARKHLKSPLKRRYSRSKSPIAESRERHIKSEHITCKKNGFQSEAQISFLSDGFGRRGKSRERSTKSRQDAGWEYNKQSRDLYHPQNTLQSEPLANNTSSELKEFHNDEEEQKTIFDISPPGTSEPPPPGYETSVVVKQKWISENYKNTFAHHTPESTQRNISENEKYPCINTDENKKYRHWQDNENSRSRSSVNIAEKVKRCRNLESNPQSRKENEAEGHKRKKVDDKVKHNKSDTRHQHVESFIVNSYNKTEKCLKIGDELTSKTQNEIIVTYENITDKKEENHDKHIKERKKKKKNKEERDRKKHKKEKREERYHVKQNAQQKSKDHNHLILSEMKNQKDGQNINNFKREGINEGEHHEKKNHTINKCDLTKNFIQDKNDSKCNLVTQCVENDNNSPHQNDLSKMISDQIPGLSKWEREDEHIYKDCLNSKPLDFLIPNTKNETLDIGKSSVNFKDVKAEKPASQLNVSMKVSSSIDTMENVHITIPCFSKQQRSVELKEDNAKNTSLPIVNKSVKDRLGFKVVGKSLKLQSKEVEREFRYKSRSSDRFRSLKYERTRTLKQREKCCKYEENIINNKDQQFEISLTKQSTRAHDSGGSKNNLKSSNYMSLHKTVNHDQNIEHRNRDYEGKVEGWKLQSDHKVTQEHHKYKVAINQSGNHSFIRQRKTINSALCISMSEKGLGKCELKPVTPTTNDLQIGKTYEGGQEMQKVNTLKSRSSGELSYTSFDSNSESDGIKLKKKKKHKKEKKRKKRAYSIESVECSKKKPSKSKKDKISKRHKNKTK